MCTKIFSYLAKHIRGSSISKILGMSVFLFIGSGVFISYALDVLDYTFPPEVATSSGSSNSQIWFSTGVSLSGTTYVNKNNDSDVLGNYFQGYYYDNVLGFFKLDWNTTDTTTNVHVASSSDKCNSGYGYKLAGYAQSTTAGFIQFDYSPDIYVYYCEVDKKLHGNAYSEHSGFQSFEGIGFEILAFSQNSQNLAQRSDPFFVNNNSLLLVAPASLSGGNTAQNSIQGKGLATDGGQEVFFYIIK